MNRTIAKQIEKFVDIEIQKLRQAINSLPRIENPNTSLSKILRYYFTKEHFSETECAFIDAAWLKTDGLLKLAYEHPETINPNIPDNDELTKQHYRMLIDRYIANPGLQIPNQNSAQPFRFFVKTLTGRTVPMLGRPNETVDEVKQNYYEMEGVPQDQQRFIFSGRQLEDGRTLGEYDIHEQATIHLVLRLRGD